MKLIISLSFLLSQLAFAGLPPTTSKGSGDASNITTFNYQFPNFSVTHTGATAAFNILGAAGGGTGLGTLTLNSLLVGAGTGNVTFIAPGSNGNVLTSNGTTWSSAAPPSAAGVLTSTSTNYTALSSDDNIVETAAAKTITLLTGATTGKRVGIISENTGQTTLTPAAGNICGQTSITLNGQRDSISLVADGTNWVDTATRCEVAHRVSYQATTSATSNIVQDGAWVSSVGWTSIGQQTINITSGVFSSAPTCTCTYGPGGQNAFCQFTSLSSSAIAVQLVTPSSGTASIWVTCRGPR